ncbi:DUF6880 family protein [Nonomuraea wenchangensis]|uniref:DUF6880 family protein n=1 Tax=Nonomuraea wenchangensis TaxID=568860 RepID=UPI003322D0B6
MERGRGLRREYPELAGELGRFLRRHPYEDLDALVAYLRAADAEGVRELIDRLRREPDADPRSGRREYSRRVREVIDHGERALRNGQAGAVCDGLRSAVERVAGALATIDDSSGIVGDDLAELMRLYARACGDAPPPPQALAAWLVGMWLDGPGLPRVAVRDFAPALGPDGLDACAGLVEERCSGARRGSPAADRGVRELREQLAELSGDLDAYVAVLTEDLRSTARFLAVATVLRDHGRAADAEEWARRGLAAGPGDPVAAGKLRDLLVGLLLERGAAGEAVAVRRAAFEHLPDPDRYGKLRETAERAGVWAALRPGALDHLRAKRQVSYVVTVLTAEGSHEEAWQTALAADPGEVPGEQWLTIIARREHERPADVVGPYRRLIDDCLADAGQVRYNQVAELLIRLRAVQHGLDDEAGFAAYLGELRERHKRRPALIARLADL